jgi:hypothetical protein
MIALRDDDAARVQVAAAFKPLRALKIPSKMRLRVDSLDPTALPKFDRLDAVNIARALDASQS